MNTLTYQVLLERKNICFRNFLKISVLFLEEIERNDISQLDDFQRKRMALMKIIEKLDQEIALQLKDLTELTDVCKKLHLEFQKNIQAILNVDLKITENLERIKSNTLNKISQLSTSRKTINAYRSPIDVVEEQENKQSAGIKA